MSKYIKQYQEIKLIGRGSYGSAHLVKRKSDSSLFVAKKMHLQGMKQKQQQSAQQQVQILKKLNSCFIVKYIDSFLDDGLLIIIMQYCQEGDLTFFIKNKKKKNQMIQQNVITNWMIQLILGLKTIHQSKILHRDIKSSNIFLTSNKTIKIGDFGIAKVLETIREQANTFVGTPYYLSPQVCEGRSYSFKSDIWALGCVIYQLCTLNYVFNANSLLALANKIVKDKVQKIPNQYSNDLAELVSRMLNKKQSDRPNITQILQNKFIQSEIYSYSKMIEQGKNFNFSVPIKGTKVKQIEKNSTNLESTNKTTSTLNYTQTVKSEVIQTLTPEQRRQLRKQQQARKQFQLKSQAARNNIVSKNMAKQRKNLQLQGSQSSTKWNQYNKKLDVQKQKTIQFNSHTKPKQEHKKIIQLNNMETLNSYAYNTHDTRFQEIPLHTTTEYIKINKHEQQQQLQKYYDQQFEQFEQQETRITPQAPQSDLKRISKIYQEQLKNIKTIQSPKKKEIKQQSKTENNVLELRKKKIQNCKKRIGQNKFLMIYQTMKQFSQKDTPPKKIYEYLLKYFGSELKEQFKIIEQYIYYEYYM